MNTKNILTNLDAPTVLTWAARIVVVVALIWACAYVARVASEFGKGIFVVLVMVLVIGLYFGPWFFSVVHATGLMH